MTRRSGSGGSNGGGCNMGSTFTMIILLLKIALSVFLSLLIVCTIWALIASIAKKDSSLPEMVTKIVDAEAYGPVLSTINSDYPEQTWYKPFCLGCLLAVQCLCLLGVCLESACGLIFFVLMNVIMLIIRVTVLDKKVDTSSLQFIIFIAENIALAVYSIVICSVYCT